MDTTPDVERSDDAFLAAFEDTTLPFAEWTHRAHVRVAFLYLSRHPFDEALARVRRGIPRYNDAHGVANTDTSGYHETVTVAFMRLVAEVYRRGASGDSATFLDANPALLDKHILERHYSKEMLGTPAARRAFVEPDRLPLPTG